MAGSVVVSLVGVILVITIGVFLVNDLIYIFAEGGFGEFLTAGFDKIHELFGTDLGYVFSSLVLIVLLIFLFRFLISWIGEDSGSSANK